MNPADGAAADEPKENAGDAPNVGGLLPKGVAAAGAGAPKGVAAGAEAIPEEGWAPVVAAPKAKGAAAAVDAPNDATAGRLNRDLGASAGAVAAGGAAAAAPKAKVDAGVDADAPDPKLCENDADADVTGVELIAA